MKLSLQSTTSMAGKVQLAENLLSSEIIKTTQEYLDIIDKKIDKTIYFHLSNAHFALNIYFKMGLEELVTKDYL